MAEQKKKRGSMLTAILILAITVLLSLSAVKWFRPQSDGGTTIDIAEDAFVSRICELATLKCYYHNVAEYENQAPIFKYGLFRYDYKKFFIEYSGVVEGGIDASQIVVNPPSADGTVEVHVPEAEILNVYADKDSLTEPISDVGLFTTVSAEEIATAFAEAQKTMREEAENDSAILNQAKENARDLLEYNIVNAGTQVGKEYTVKWI